MSEPAAAPSIRPIVLLSAAAFASAATLRVADPLLPQIAGEFATTAGGASVIATAFAVSYGLCQVFVGALGDRFGKYTVIAVATFLSGLTVAAAQRRHRRRHHPARHGLSRRCGRLRAPPDRARALPLRPDPRRHLRPSL